MEADFEGEGVPHLFWAVELVPGKEYTTTVPADLHIAQAVLPASAKDSGRSVVTIQFEEDEEKKTKGKAFAISSLRLDNQDSQALEVVVDEGATITLSVSGKNPVHLSGYYVPDDSGEEGGFYGDEDDELDSDEFGSEGEEDGSEDEDEEAIQAATAAKIDAKRKQAQNGGNDAKKAKVEVAAAPQQPKQKQSPQQPKQEAKKQEKPQQQQQKAQPKVFQNGLQITTTREGAGAEATKGRKVSVKYVGKLTKNGKVFDASTKPFTFTLGAREVITGWDLGVAGMKVGEKRVLVIPSELGYGKEGAGREIPPNSSLTFDVELLNVK